MPRSSTSRAARKEADPSSFDAVFRAAAERVLRRRGVPDDKIEAEIERIRRIEPSFRLPALEELDRRPGRAARD